jgi:hypothetical protein
LDANVTIVSFIGKFFGGFLENVFTFSDKQSLLLFGHEIDICIFAL